MLPSIVQQVEWSPEEADRLAQFLSSPTGRRLLEVLVVNQPAPLAPTTDANGKLGEIRGYQTCYRLLVSLTSVEQSQGAGGVSALQQAANELEQGLPS